jgi:hypothetical protein
MIIIKTLGQDTFSWNPNAFNKKGHWFLLAETGSYIRVATKQEMNKLGRPKKQDENQIDVKTGEKKMSYQRAAEIRKKSLKNLITDKLVEGEGIGSSIGGSISEKMKARSKGLKEKFDPLNIAKMLTGKLGSALLGKITGRSKEDIGYFAGDKKYKETKAKPSYVNANLNKSDAGLYSAISEGNNQSMKKGDGIATVLARMYNLIKFQQIESIKRFRIEKNFKKIEEKQKNKWNKELIDALKNKKTATVITEGKKEEDGGFNIFKYIGDKIAGALRWASELISGLWSPVGKFISILGAIGGFLGLEEILNKAKSFFGLGKKELPTVPEMEKPKTKETPKVKDGTNKELEKDEKKGKESSKELEKGEKKGKEKYKEEKAKATKVDKAEEKPKATKMSKVLKGAKGVAKYLTKLPFIGGIAGAIEMIGTIQQAITDREEEKITDEELKKIVITTTASIIAAGAGTSIGATIGATVGSVAGPIGAFLGGATGAVAGYVGGKTAGKAGAEKLFEYLSNSSGDVEPTATPVQAETMEKQTVSPTESKTPKAADPQSTTTTPTTTSSTPSTTTPAKSSSTTTPSSVTPVPTPNATDNRLQSTMNKNMEIKSAAGSSVNTTVIDNSQTIGSPGGGGSGGIVVESSVGVRTDEPTLQRVQGQNRRTT